MHMARPATTPRTKAQTLLRATGSLLASRAGVAEGVWAGEGEGASIWRAQILSPGLLGSQGEVIRPFPNPPDPLPGLRPPRPGQAGSPPRWPRAPPGPGPPQRARAGT